MLRATGYNKSAVSAQTGPHPRYHFFGYAGDQITGDGKFFDRSGMGNHAVRGANLSDTQLFATPGYVTTANPVTGATDSVLRMPNLNFDYAGGEKLLIYWIGKASPEAAAAGLLGDGYTATYPGLRLRANANGTLQPVLYDAANGSGVFGGTSAGVPFDGNLHSLAFVLDGSAKKYGMWVDEEMEAAFGGGYLSFGSGASVDTRNANTFQIGSPIPAAGAGTDGLATQTRSLHIIRFGASDTVPPAATVTAAIKQLRANPGKPILGGAF